MNQTPGSKANRTVGTKMWVCPGQGELAVKAWEPREALPRLTSPSSTGTAMPMGVQGALAQALQMELGVQGPSLNALAWGRRARGQGKRAHTRRPSIGPAPSAGFISSGRCLPAIQTLPRLPLARVRPHQDTGRLSCPCSCSAEVGCFVEVKGLYPLTCTIPSGSCSWLRKPHSRGDKSGS